MPLILVTRHPSVTDDAIEPLLTHIRQIVAEGLTIPGHVEGELEASEIEVMVQETQPLDQNIKDIAIIVWANEYPERRKNLDERRWRIAQRIRELLPTKKYSGSL